MIANLPCELRAEIARHLNVFQTICFAWAMGLEAYNKTQPAIKEFAAIQRNTILILSFDRLIEGSNILSLFIGIKAPETIVVPTYHIDSDEGFRFPRSKRNGRYCKTKKRVLSAESRYASCVIVLQ